jgi:hypothetical protein
MLDRAATDRADVPLTLDVDAGAPPVGDPLPALVAWVLSVVRERRAAAVGPNGRDLGRQGGRVKRGGERDGGKRGRTSKRVR